MPITLDQVWGHQTAQTSIWFTTRYGMDGIQQQVFHLWVHNVDKQKLRLRNIWRCMDHFVTDDATTHILVHVCGQLSSIMTVLISI